MKFDLPNQFISILLGGLWHTTVPERFNQIQQSGEILPEPPIADDLRWKTLNGPENYSFVRTLGGVSLFDFLHFDPATYSEKCPLSNWDHFVPFQNKYGEAIWIEIDREKVLDKLILPVQLVKKWKDESAYKHTLMPCIEAAHIGPLPMTSAIRAIHSAKGKEPISLLV